MARENKNGLSRHIPEPVAREVRQRCGFGCIFCGCMIYEYHHFDPPFADATAHNANGIALLCDTHHGLTKRHKLTTVQVRDAYRHPKCLSRGFSHEPLHLEAGNFRIELGGLRATNVGTILRIFGEPLLCVERAETQQSPLRLSARFYDASDRDGKLPILSIEQNRLEHEESVLNAAAGNWDIVSQGQEITIRSALRRIEMVLVVDPPNRIALPRLSMFYRGVHVQASSDARLRVATADGRHVETHYAEVNGCDVLFDITEQGLSVGESVEAAAFDRFRLG